MSGGRQTAMVTATSLVIVDDHELLGQSLALALQAEGIRVERCVDLTEAGILGSLRTAGADLVLLDLDLGGELGTTLPLIGPITATGADVVMLTGIRDRVRLAECLEAGASGIVAKSQPFDELLDVVRRAATTGNLLSPGDRTAYLAQLRRHRAEQRDRLRVFEQLTLREAQVLDALLEGRSAEQIATGWVVSITTVRSQIRSLLLKLGVNSQLSAVALAHRAGWRSVRS